MNKAESKVERHSEICACLSDIYRRKNHDYGDSFGETYRKLGIISAVTRIVDKTNRLTSLCAPNARRMVSDETLRDTLLDAANYCIMTVIEMDAATAENVSKSDGIYCEVATHERPDNSG